jgi:hypothetical protein
MKLWTYKMLEGKKKNKFTCKNFNVVLGNSYNFLKIKISCLKTFF